ncbi:MAG: propionyl-CoA carboxylase [Deltaproteobacteria bacterium]|nr:propionyl-CoA carboxylase [Deltaproteobacteria bacterium]
MSWDEEVEGIRARRKSAKAQGGSEQVAKQHARGRLTVRERIEGLLDPDSFRERAAVAGEGEQDDQGQLKSFTPASVVMGIGKLDGRQVVVCGDDFTVAGASYSAAGMKKGTYADDLSARRRLPMVRLLEGGGARITGLTKGGRSGYDLTQPSTANLAMLEAFRAVPVVCAALGPVAGFPAARLVTSHLSIMTRQTAQVLIGGPALVERATHEKLTKEELGGSPIHLRSGVVDNVAEDEAGVWEQIRAFLSFLPSRVGEASPIVDLNDPRDRREPKLLEIVPRARRRAYKMRRLIHAIIDTDSFFEIASLFGRSQITGLARLEGRSVGIFANDPVHQGGSMTADGARKVRRFVELCDQFNLPVIALVDEPGFLIGSESEQAGTIRAGVETLAATMQSRVPWASVIVRKSFGVAAGIHLGPGSTTFAWPSAEFGAMPIEGGVALAYGREIEAAPDPEARRRELEDELANAQSVFPRAEEFGVHDLIDPRDTRPVLCEWLDEVANQLEENLRQGVPRYTARP